MVITRNIQLTVKKTARQTKTLEGSLQTKSRNGERTSVSSRVAELDQIMPHHLGVSKAILELVIFCHQDESLWPMSEPLSLKKKFDEIFEALKYTKAIDNIKALRKAKADELKRLKDQEQYSKDIKNKGDKAERDARELSAALDNIKAEIRDHDQKAKEADENYRDASDRAAKYMTIIGSLDNKKSRQQMLQSHLNDLEKYLKKRDESDERLQAELDHHHTRMAEHQKLEKQQTIEYQELERSSQKAEAKLSSKHAEAGKYEEQKASHLQQIEKRKALVMETSRQHNIRGYDTDLDDMQISEYIDKISRLSKDQNAAVEKARRDTEREIRKAQDILNKLGEQRSVLTENKNAAKQRINTNTITLRAQQSQLNEIETDEGGKAILEANIEEVQLRLRKAKEDSRNGSWDSKLKDNESQLNLLNEEHRRVNEDYLEGTKHAGELARLDQLKKDVAECQRNLNKMKGVHGDRLKMVTGHFWEPTNLEDHFQRAINQRNSELKQAEQDRETISREKEQVDYRLSNTKADLKKAEKESNMCLQILNDNVGGEPMDYIETLSNIQEARDLFKADSDNFENTRQYFAKGINVAQGESHCNLCKRQFHGRELTDFVKKMEEKLAKLTAEKVAKDLKEAEEDLRKAKGAGSSYDTWSRLSKTEIPKLHGDIRNYSSDRERLIHDLEEYDRAVKDKEEAKLFSESLVKPVTNIVKYQNDLERFANQAKEITINQKDSGMPLTLDETRQQLQTIQGSIQDVRSKSDKLRAERERARALVSSLELELSKESNNLSNATYQLDKKQNIARQIDELRTAGQDYQDTIKSVDLKLHELTPQYAEEETKREDVQRRGRDKESGLQQEASKLHDSVRRLELAAKNIAAYLENGGSANLDKCGREIKAIGQEIRDKKDQQRQVTIAINRIQKEMANQESTKRTISDNITYRRHLRELEGVKNDISKLSAENDDADREHWLKQTQYWKRVLTEHTTEKTSKLGAARAKDDELVRLMKDWETEYKDAAKKFKRAHIEVEVGEDADIQRFTAYTQPDYQSSN